MDKITSNMTLPQKLRAHAANIVELDELLYTQAAWCMRDAANVIESQNLVLNRLEEAYNDFTNDRSLKMGKRQE